jgi:glycosyltransferase involved in cell wall biosynthesis
VSKRVEGGKGKDDAIVFMGTMNAMPMMYALELKKLGYEVIYFVDVPKRDTLSRPENHFPDIAYPYPSWIVERVLPSQILLSLFPRLFAVLYRLQIERLTKSNIGCFVLNGFFVSLAPYLSQRADIVGLSHGSDLDVWANTEGAEGLFENFKNQSLFKYLPRSISRRLIKYVVNNQYQGYAHSETVVYFPTGFNTEGDNVIHRLVKLGVKYVPRYDVSFEPLRGQPREFKDPERELVIFSGVRFLFRTFFTGYRGENKGNDLIIEGIANYFSVNPNIRVHFVEKGEDVQYAKEICRNLGLDSVVVWHKEMPFKELLKLYRESDICFDQVGEHWIGAIGAYALWLGKPLIANEEAAVRSGIWPVDNPVCSARTSEEICEWLVRLEDVALRKKVAESSKEFAEAHLRSSDVLEKIFKLQQELP